MDLAGRNVAVVGLGASGVAAAHLCLARGAKVTATDSKGADQIGEAARALGSAGARLVLGGHSAAGLPFADLVVISPGVPSFPELEAAEQRGVPVIGELELAVRCMRHPAPLVAIGGTNGKSTTTTLVGEMLRGTNPSVFVGGNLGEPLSRHTEQRFDVIVVEVSSFQLERAPTFHPKVSVLLNVTDDHLDRYPSFEAYAHTKGNAFALQGPTDVAVIPVDDPTCAREARRGRGRIVTFGPRGTVDVREDVLLDTRTEEAYSRAEIGIRGRHNADNAAAAVAVCGAMGVAGATMRQVLASFQGLPHRMARAGEFRGVRFYDDSKGTNVGAAVTALLGLDEPHAVLIAGGRDKGGSYGPLVQALRAKGRAAVLIGEAAPAIQAAIGDAVPVERAATMRDAVRAGARLAKRGDAVLLSPACSSYDMFTDYKHRGDEFVREVAALSVEGT